MPRLDAFTSSRCTPSQPFIGRAGGVSDRGNATGRLVAMASPRRKDYVPRELQSRIGKVIFAELSKETPRRNKIVGEAAHRGH
jgi:hypothetical protein